MRGRKYGFTCAFAGGGETGSSHEIPTSPMSFLNRKWKKFEVAYSGGEKWDDFKHSLPLNVAYLSVTTRVQRTSHWQAAHGGLDPLSRPTLDGMGVPGARGEIVHLVSDKAGAPAVSLTLLSRPGVSWELLGKHMRYKPLPTQLYR